MQHGKEKSLKSSCNKIIIITTHQQCCGKLMFSSHVCLSVSLSTGGGGPMWPLPNMHWTSLYNPLYRALAPCWGHLVGKIRHLFTLVHLRTSLYSYPPPQLLLTSGGCLLKQVWWRVVGTHPTEMLSCLRYDGVGFKVLQKWIGSFSWLLSCGNW